MIRILLPLLALAFPLVSNASGYETETHDLSCFATGTSSNFAPALRLESREVYYVAGEDRKYGFSKSTLRATMPTYLDDLTKAPRGFAIDLPDLHARKDVRLARFAGEEKADPSLALEAPEGKVSLTAHAADVKELTSLNPIGGVILRTFEFPAHLSLKPADGSDAYDGEAVCEEAYTGNFVMTGLSPGWPH